MATTLIVRSPISLDHHLERQVQRVAARLESGSQFRKRIMIYPFTVFIIAGA
jgi:hypothetical protein